MDIDDAAWISVDEEVRDHRQEAGEDDEVDVISLQQRENHLGRVQLYLRYNGRRHTQPLGAFQRVGISSVADDEGNVYVLGMLEIPDDILAVGAVTRHEDGDGHFV